ncbi:hypothetical protein SAMN05444920_112122 [Nonomuraea solani]|uniref:Uncharacterized protein n=1 Tax=Nonomuraea solani TaxID=1144553 RepID=A0A1H6EM44_9ACTN|nr:hypothetical protein [Nonomuraea solani]SEG98932.1 hypothetical protein SAMN05444920_112122 [Nonomuraea solani]
MDTLPKLAVAGATVGVGLVALAGAVIAGSAIGDQPRPVLRWTPGACVTGDYALTACNGGESEVVAVAPGPPEPGDCPVDTDDVLRIDAGRTACVRNFLDPHPGAPGGGGGLLRAGDCVTLDGQERACAQPGWYGRAVAIEPEPAACPTGTLDTLESETQVVCLGAGGQVLDRGSCVAKPATNVLARSAVARVPCDSPHAWAKVLSFETAPVSCPPDSQRYLRATEAYRPVTCLDVLSQ